MTFVITVVAICASGLALLYMLRLETGSRVVDAALSWFVGSGWFALAAMVLRFLPGVPISWPSAAAIVLAPPIVWVACGSRARHDPPGPNRWLPRPAWVFGPIAVFVILTLFVVLLHGANTPTHTDDGVRVRAFAPILAFQDTWSTEARGILSMAGAVPTFVPAFAWLFTGKIDHFHVNYVVLADLISLVILVIGLGISRGSPERGWASAFGLLSVPLFIYHCTSTYADAVLAIFIGGGLLFATEYGRTHDSNDAYRSLVLLVGATMVKREGGTVAASAAVVLVAQLLWDRWHGARNPVLPIALAALAVVMETAARIAAVGLSGAFPVVKLLLSRGEAVSLGVAQISTAKSAHALTTYLYALFHSGNQGMVLWLLPAAVAVCIRAVLRPHFAWPFASITLLYAETTVFSLWLAPEWTLDQSTVHRALMVVSVPAALWLGALLADEVHPLGAPRPFKSGTSTHIRKKLASPAGFDR